MFIPTLDFFNTGSLMSCRSFLRSGLASFTMNPLELGSSMPLQAHMCVSFAALACGIARMKTFAPMFDFLHLESLLVSRSFACIGLSLFGFRAACIGLFPSLRFHSRVGKPLFMLRMPRLRKPAFVMDVVRTRSSSTSRSHA